MEKLSHKTPQGIRVTSRNRARRTMTFAVTVSEDCAEEWMTALHMAGLLTNHRQASVLISAMSQECLSEWRAQHEAAVRERLRMGIDRGE